MLISIVIPAKNESENLENILPKLCDLSEKNKWEIIVVNDGSTDNTQAVLDKYSVVVVRHKYSMGNGAAIKAGARKASGEVIVFMDADGQHDPRFITELSEGLNDGYDMVVASRDRSAQASYGRYIANNIYNKLATYIVGHKIEDLTSGFRAVRADKFKEFLYLLPNGFSYPTTITMAFFRAGYAVKYLPTEVYPRIGKSHIRIMKDGIRFFLIIFKIGTLYSPLKVFFPASFFFIFLGITYYLFTYIAFGRFTNMSALLFSSAVIIFLYGLISEQITTLFYKRDS